MAAKVSNAPVLGIDLGGTKVLAGVVGADNTILSRAKRSTPAKQGAEAILAAVVDCAHEALDSAGVPLNEIAGVGIGTPGPLDVERGIILFSANMNVRDFELGPDLSVALGRPVLIQNDVRVGGYGEFRLGAGRGYRNILAAFVGTGIGGCVIVNGQIVTGVTGNAGELGHITVKAGGTKCGCGLRGCLEAMASRSAIARRVGKSLRKGLTSSLALKVDKKGGRLKSGELAEAFLANDPVAVKEVQRAARYLGIGLGSLANVLGPEIVILGGGVVAAIGEPYLDLVRQSFHAHAIVDHQHKIKIEPAALGDDAGLLGSALMARERFASKHS